MIARGARDRDRAQQRNGKVCKEANERDARIARDNNERHVRLAYKPTKDVGGTTETLADRENIGRRKRHVHALSHHQHGAAGQKGKADGSTTVREFDSASCVGSAARGRGSVVTSVSCRSRGGDEGRESRFERSSRTASERSARRKGQNDGRIEQPP